MKRKWMWASLALASVGLLVGPLQGTEVATPKIKVHYIDVGQGDAIYIKMPQVVKISSSMVATKGRAMHSSLI